MAINKTNAAIYAPFVNALAAGQKVEYRSPNTGNWYVPKGGFVFDDADPSNYRIVVPGAAQQDDEQYVYKVVLRNNDTGETKLSKNSYLTKAKADSTRFKAKFTKVAVVKVLAD